MLSISHSEGCISSRESMGRKPVLAVLGIIVLEVWWCVLGCLGLVVYCFRHKNEWCCNLVWSTGLKEYGESVVLPRLWVYHIGNSLSSWTLLLEVFVLYMSGVTFESTCLWFSSALWDSSVDPIDTIQHLCFTFYFFRKKIVTVQHKEYILPGK